MPTTQKQRQNIENYKGRVKIPSEKQRRLASYPKSSWWLKAGFYEAAKAEQGRMRQSPLGRSNFESLAG